MTDSIKKEPPDSCHGNQWNMYVIQKSGTPGTATWSTNQNSIEADINKASNMSGVEIETGYQLKYPTEVKSEKQWINRNHCPAIRLKIDKHQIPGIVRETKGDDHVTSIPTTVEWYGQRNECDCFECGESLESDNHNCLHRCSKCCFETICTAALYSHYSHKHGHRYKTREMGKQVVVTEYDTRYLLQCANCGFQTPISLKMALHLSSSLLECKSCKVNISGPIVQNDYDDDDETEMVQDRHKLGDKRPHDESMNCIQKQMQQKSKEGSLTKRLKMATGLPDILTKSMHSDEATPVNSKRACILEKLVSIKTEPITDYSDSKPMAYENDALFGNTPQDSEDSLNSDHQCTASQPMKTEPTEMNYEFTQNLDETHKTPDSASKIMFPQTYGVQSTNITPSKVVDESASSGFMASAKSFTKSQKQSKRRPSSRIVDRCPPPAVVIPNPCMTAIKPMPIAVATVPQLVAITLNPTMAATGPQGDVISPISVLAATQPQGVVINPNPIMAATQPYRSLETSMASESAQNKPQTAVPIHTELILKDGKLQLTLKGSQNSSSSNQNRMVNVPVVPETKNISGTASLQNPQNNVPVQTVLSLKDSKFQLILKGVQNSSNSGQRHIVNVPVVPKSRTSTSSVQTTLKYNSGPNPLSLLSPNHNKVPNHIGVLTNSEAPKLSSVNTMVQSSVLPHLSQVKSQSLLKSKKPPALPSKSLTDVQSLLKSKEFQALPQKSQLAIRSLLNSKKPQIVPQQSQVGNQSLLNSKKHQALPQQSQVGNLSLLSSKKHQAMPQQNQVFIPSLVKSNEPPGSQVDNQSLLNGNESQLLSLHRKVDTQPCMKTMVSDDSDVDHLMSGSSTMQNKVEACEKNIYEKEYTEKLQIKTEQSAEDMNIVNSPELYIDRDIPDDRASIVRNSPSQSDDDKDIGDDDDDDDDGDDDIDNDDGDGDLVELFGQKRVKLRDGRTTWVKCEEGEEEEEVYGPLSDQDIPTPPEMFIRLLSTGITPCKRNYYYLNIKLCEMDGSQVPFDASCFDFVLKDFPIVDRTGRAISSVKNKKIKDGQYHLEFSADLNKCLNKFYFNFTHASLRVQDVTFDPEGQQFTCDMCNLSFNEFWEIHAHSKFVHKEKWIEKIAENKVPEDKIIWESGNGMINPAILTDITMRQLSGNDSLNNFWDLDGHKFDSIVPVLPNGKLKCRFCEKSFWNGIFLHDHIRFTHLQRDNNLDVLILKKETTYFDKVANFFGTIEKCDVIACKEQDMKTCLTESCAVVDKEGAYIDINPGRRVVTLLYGFEDYHFMLFLVNSLSWVCTICDTKFKMKDLASQLKNHNCLVDSYIQYIHPAVCKKSLNSFKIYSINNSCKIFTTVDTKKSHSQSVLQCRTCGALTGISSFYSHECRHLKRADMCRNSIEMYEDRCILLCPDQLCRMPFYDTFHMQKHIASQHTSKVHCYVCRSQGIKSTDCCEHFMNALFGQHPKNKVRSEEQDSIIIKDRPVKAKMLLKKSNHYPKLIAEVIVDEYKFGKKNHRIVERCKLCGRRIYYGNHLEQCCLKFQDRCDVSLKSCRFCRKVYLSDNHECSKEGITESKNDSLKDNFECPFCIILSVSSFKGQPVEDCDHLLYFNERPGISQHFKKKWSALSYDKTKKNVIEECECNLCLKNLFGRDNWTEHTSQCCLKFIKHDKDVSVKSCRFCQKLFMYSVHKCFPVKQSKYWSNCARMKVRCPLCPVLCRSALIYFEHVVTYHITEIKCCRFCEILYTESVQRHQCNRKAESKYLARMSNSHQPGTSDVDKSCMNCVLCKNLHLGSIYNDSCEGRCSLCTYTSKCKGYICIHCDRVFHCRNSFVDHTKTVHWLL